MITSYSQEAESVLTSQTKTTSWPISLYIKLMTRSQLANVNYYVSPYSEEGEALHFNR